MRRRTVLFIAVGCLAVLGVGIAPWTLANDYAAQRISKHVKVLTGLTLDVEGETTLALLPAPRIKMENVVLRDSRGEAVLRSTQFRGQLLLLPLLSGELELADVLLFEPTVHVTTRQAGVAPEGGATAKASATGEQAQSDHVTALAPLRTTAGWLSALGGVARAGRDSRFPLISRIVVVGGTIELDSNRDGLLDGEPIRDINTVIAWPDPSGPVSLAGSAIYRNRLVEAVVSGFSPLTLLAGSENELSVRLKTDNDTFSGRGTLSDRGDRFDGRLNFATTSLSGFDHWLGNAFPLARVVDKFSVSGPVVISNRGLSFSNASITVENDKLEGALSARLSGGRLGVSGTIAASALELDRFIHGIYPSLDTSGSWNREPIDRTMLAQADLDLRLSATSATLDGTDLSDLACGVMLRNGRFEFSVNRVGAYGGFAKGKLVLAPGNDGFDARLQMALDQMDVGQASGSLFGVRRISGQGTAQVSVEARGHSVMELAQSMNGRAAIAINGGELLGVDLADLLRRVERRPLSVTTDWRGGRTPFEQFGGAFIITAGNAELDDMRMTAPRLRAVMTGRTSVAERGFSIAGRILPRSEAAQMVPPVQALVPPQALAPSQPLPSSGESTASAPAEPQPAPGLAFELNGSWDHPRLGPDVKALIRRSGSAALLDRVRTSETREIAPAKAVTAAQ